MTRHARPMRVPRIRRPADTRLLAGAIIDGAVLVALWGAAAALLIVGPQP